MRRDEYEFRRVIRTLSQPTRRICAVAFLACAPSRGMCHGATNQILWRPDSTSGARIAVPIRIQRKRTKGWRMPEGTVYVGRPTLFGNPIVINNRCTPKEAVKAYRFLLTASQSKIADAIIHEDRSPAPFGGLGMIVWRQKVRRELPKLRGKNLACFCSLDQPCHADVLLKIANR